MANCLDSDSYEEDQKIEMKFFQKGKLTSAFIHIEISVM